MTSTVDQSDEQSLKQGMSVEITAEALNQTANGTLTAIGPFSSGGSGSSTTNSGQPSGTDSGTSDNTQPGYPVTVTPTTALDSATWLGQNVRLTVNGASTAGKVLAVPVAAITTTANGTASVTVVGPGGGQKQVLVTVGVVANGLCQISPVTAGAVTAGQTVVIGQ